MKTGVALCLIVFATTAFLICAPFKDTRYRCLLENKNTDPYLNLPPEIKCFRTNADDQIQFYQLSSALALFVAFLFIIFQIMVGITGKRNYACTKENEQEDVNTHDFSRIYLEYIDSTGNSRDVVVVRGVEDNLNDSSVIYYTLAECLKTTLGNAKLLSAVSRYIQRKLQKIQNSDNDSDTDSDSDSDDYSNNDSNDSNDENNDGDGDDNNNDNSDSNSETDANNNFNNDFNNDSNDDSYVDDDSVSNHEQEHDPEHHIN